MQLFGSSKRTAKSILVVLLVLGAGFFVFHSTFYDPRKQEPKESVGNPEENTLSTIPITLEPRTQSSSNSAALPTGTHLPLLPALPPLDAPLFSQLDALKERAEAGEPIASCRLIIAATRCRELIRHQRVTAQMRRSLERGRTGNERILVDVIASTELQGTAGFCDNLDVDQLPTAESLFARAVSSMTPRQKTVLALMRSDGRIRRINQDMHFTESALYVIPQYLAENTRSLLLDGFSARDPLALEGLVLLHAPGTAMGPQGASVWLPNPREFYRYGRLMQDLFGADSLGARGTRLLESTRATLGPSEISMAEEFVHFEHSRWRTGSHDALLKHEFRSTGSVENSQLSSCE